MRYGMRLLMRGCLFEFDGFLGTVAADRGLPLKVEYCF